MFVSSIQNVRFSAVALGVSVLTVAGCGSDPVAKNDTPRPVTTIPLQDSSDGRVNKVTGSVGAWKQEDLAFEVSGRLETVIERGRNIDGRQRFIKLDSDEGPAPSISRGFADLETIKTLISEIDGDPAGAPPKYNAAKEEELVETLNDLEVQLDRTAGPIQSAQDAREKTIPHSDAAVQPTVLARLDAERYLNNVEAAEAALAVAQRQAVSVLTNLRSTNPAEQMAARADLKFADAELARTKELRQRGAGTVADEQRAQAEREMKLAGLRTSLAARKDLVAKLESGLAEVRQAMQNLRDARRDLRETELFSAFGGQVADVQAISGTYVSAGTPVLTVQMMDLVQVELEVSARESLQFRHGDTVEITTQSELNDRTLTGFVHMSDPVADPSTRTFTVTLLCRNKQIYDVLEQVSSATDINDIRIARTEDTMPMNIGSILGYSDETLLIGEECVCQDERGEFVWKVENRDQETLNSRDQKLKVSKIRIERESTGISFLGDWNFFPVRIKPNQDFNPEKDLVAGKLFVGTVPERDADPATEEHADEESKRQQEQPLSERIIWKRDRGEWPPTKEKETEKPATYEMWYSRPRWLMRPGDLVTVTLPGETTDVEGRFIVPMRTICHDEGEEVIFVAEADEEAGRMVARRIRIGVLDTVFDETTDTLRVISIDDEDREKITADSQLIVDGAQSVSDGDPIVVTGP
ncbi:MAG: efflux RND transporter periplasmic adaptor subunit [Planctomycetaceae bacterium]|nr:efflux RND transporter periplasmic adaptor subunit [Planctomycetaceae bacterium]